MADDIYEYFSGNGGTREVEPIEEDSGEFEQGLGQDNEKEDATVTPTADPNDLFAAFPGNKPAASGDDKSKSKKETVRRSKNSESAVKKQAVPSATSESKVSGGTRDAKAVEPPADTEKTATSGKAAKKSGGNWDFLAGVLGLGGNKSTKAAAEEATAEDAEEDFGQSVSAARQSESPSARKSKAPASSSSQPVGQRQKSKATESSERPASNDEIPGDFFGFNFDDENPAKIIPKTNVAASAAAVEPADKTPKSETSGKPDAGKFVAESVAVSPSASETDDGSGLSDDDDIFSAFAAPPAKAPAGQDSFASEKKSRGNRAESDQQDADDGDDFVEFEIEDLDTSEIDPAAEAARGRRGRGRGRGRKSGAENGEPRSERSGRRPRGRGRARTQERPDESSDSGRDDSFQLDSPSKKRSGGRSQRQRDDSNRNSDDDSANFDSQFESEEIDPRDIDPRNGEVDNVSDGRNGGGRKRRGGRGRGGRNRGGRGGQNRGDGRTDSAAKTAEDRWNNPEPDGGWDNESSNSSDRDRELAAESKGRSSRSRGRRGGGRGRDREEGQWDHQEVSSRNRDDGESRSGGRDDGLRDESDRPSRDGRSGRGRNRRPRSEDKMRDERPDRAESNNRGGRGRGDRPERDERPERPERSGGSGRGRRPRGSDDSVPAVPRYGDVPTWDDAISGVISSNIKSHSGRSGSRAQGGRGRSNSSGGGSRNSGSSRSRGDGSGSDRGRGGGNRSSRGRDSGSGSKNSGRNRR